MKKGTLKQYTIRNIPPNVDAALRSRAKTLGVSFNQIALEALTVGAGESARPKRDLRGIIGSLNQKGAEEIEHEIRLQRRIDPDLWK